MDWAITNVSAENPIHLVTFCFQSFFEKSKRINEKGKRYRKKKPDDFVIATGEVHTVEEFVKESFDVVGLNWKKYVVIDPHFIPPVQTGPLCGDYSKAKKVLKWKPKTTFKELVKIMVQADLAKFS